MVTNRATNFFLSPTSNVGEPGFRTIQMSEMVANSIRTYVATVEELVTVTAAQPTTSPPRIVTARRSRSRPPATPTISAMQAINGRFINRDGIARHIQYPNTLGSTARISDSPAPTAPVTTKMRSRSASEEDL